MFGRLGERLSHYDWPAIIGAILALFFLLWLIPHVGNQHQTDYSTEYCAGYDCPTDQPQSESFWHRLFTDPVALFTSVLAVFTLILGGGTFGLWWVTERTLAHTEKASDRQLRAYVFGGGLEFTLSTIVTPNGSVVNGYGVATTWKNYGVTPAQKINVVFDKQDFLLIENREPFFEMPQTRGVGLELAPTMTSFSGGFIPIDVLVDVWQLTRELFIWGRVEYSDTSHPEIRRHSEFCIRLDVFDDPRVIPGPGQVPAFRGDVYGLQNTHI